MLFLKWIIIIVSIHSMSYKISMAIQKTGRIVGGTLAIINDFPYLMQIHMNGQLICGGALLTKRHVITAAHCVYGLEARNLQIVGGSSYSTPTAISKEMGVQRSVTRIFTPTTFNTNSMHMDVAILKLESDMSGQNIDTLPLCNVTMQVGDTIQIAGWGRVKERGKNAAASVRLRSARVPMMAHTQCKRQYSVYARVTSTMFCASKPGVRDACSGDSGGPAIYKNQICGIVSWGIGCARKNFPGVYTNVNVVKSFIRDALDK